ncbi:MAG: molybdopterin-binding protein [Defluviitaleaceae bacterium]|nr:molybdopterin-binding protein [Defluviitaleaceae bacterium]
MKKLRVEDAVGQILCHDLTRIVRGGMKGAQFKKGHVIRGEDVPLLLDMGKRHIFVWEAHEGLLHENEAAARLAALCLNDNMDCSAVSEGKIDLTAAADGLFRADTKRLCGINAIEDIIIACRHSLTPVKKGDKLAGTRVIPLAVSEAKIAHAEAIANGSPIFELLEYKMKTACIITTGSEIAAGRITDTLTPVIEDKLRGYGLKVLDQALAGDEIADIERAITRARALQPDLILCTGGMSVDPDDNTPGAIKRSGAKIVTYGAPVLPGAMFLLGYYEDGLPIMGLPGCVMYAATTVFDIVLPRVAAGLVMSKRDFAIMGNGGLCLGCKDCKFPACSFGKG